MKTLRITATALAALAVLVPAAQAGSADTTSSGDASVATTPTTTATPPTTVTTPTTTTETAPATTTTTTTTEGDVPTTVGDATTTTTTTTDGDLPLDDLVTDIPDDVAGAGDCVTATCIPMANAGGVLPVTGAGGALPFTGISDMIAPIMLALVVLLAGIVAIRWAQLREAVARTRSRRVIDAGALVAKTGYAAAMREQAINDRARSFYGPRVA